jgi:hypothetical protein
VVLSGSEPVSLALALPENRRKGSLLWLSIPLAALLLWPLTWNCYFPVKIYDSLFWALPLLLLLFSAGWFAVFVRISSKRNFELPTATGGKERSIGRSLYYSAFLGLVIGSLTLLAVDLCTLSIVYATSRTSVRFNSPISVRKGRGGKGCWYYLTFYDAPLEREITTCGEKWGVGGAKSGDTLVFEERVGPMGARLIAIRRTLDN